MSTQELRIPVHNVTLGGELDMPNHAPGVVFFAHGSGSSRFSPRNQFVARVLREAGVGTLLFDLMTQEEERAEAATRHIRFDIPFLAERLLTATRWVLEQALERDLPAGYFGSSTGAAAALVAAAELRHKISAVVSRGGRPDLAGDALSRVTAPTLLIVGKEDHPILSLNEEAYSRLRCERALRVIPGATHLFEEPGALELVARMASGWFSERLAPMASRGRS